MTTLSTERFGAATAGALPPPEPPPEPEPPKRHRVRTTVLVVLILAALVGAVFGGRLWGDHGQKAVWGVRTGLAAGATLQSGDLQQLTVKGDAADGLAPVSRSVVGEVLNRAVPAGVGLPTSALGGVSRFPRAGQNLVGIGLPSGNAPAGLQPGSKVSVYELPVSANGEKPPPAVSERILRRVGVVAVETINSGGEVATLLVPEAAAPQLAALSAQQRVALTLVS